MRSSECCFVLNRFLSIVLLLSLLIPPKKNDLVKYAAQVKNFHFYEKFLRYFTRLFLLRQNEVDTIKLRGIKSCDI